MSFFKGLLKFAGEVVQRTVHQAAQQAYSKSRSVEFGGYTLDEWDRQWQYIGVLETAELSDWNRSVGLYRARLNGEIMYVGRAVEWNNGGFRKRLSDYRRDSESGRKHGSGQKMYAHRDQLQIEILVIGEGADAADVAKKLEPLFVGKYKPEWNVMFNNR
jgi:hypothetical protein